VSARDTRPRLGRGLAALLNEVHLTSPLATEAATAEGAAPGAVRDLPIELLEPGPFQPRSPVDRESLTDLVASVRARGVLQPLLARPHPATPGRYQIIAGERRWRAAQIAGLAEIPVLLRALADADAMAAALVENLQRQDLDAIEEAEGYRRLVGEFGLSHDDLAQAVGKSRSHVSNTLRLLNLPEDVRVEVKNGRLSAGHARALLAHPDPGKAALQVLARGLNVRQTEALAAGMGAAAPITLTGASPREPRRKSPEAEAVERDLTERLGLRVEVIEAGAGGSVRVHYRSFDQLDGLIALLGRG
jgi:ParB family chromosome partitioning protein